MWERARVLSSLVRKFNEKPAVGAWLGAYLSIFLYVLPRAVHSQSSFRSERNGGEGHAAGIEPVRGWLVGMTCPNVWAKYGKQPKLSLIGNGKLGTMWEGVALWLCAGEGGGGTVVVLG